MFAKVYYGGVPYHIIRNAIYCKKCKDTISSVLWSVHDYKKCSCGAVGLDDERIIGNLADMETRRMYIAYINEKTIWLPQRVVEEVWIEWTKWTAMAA